MQYGDVPFRWWVIDNFWKPLTPERMADAMMHRWQVSYDNDVERGKKTSCDFITMFPEMQMPFAKLRDPEQIERFTKMTGINDLQDDCSMHGAGLHLSVDGSFLQSHVDYEIHPLMPNLERRLNAILFIHNRWEPEWGGQLLLCDMAGKPVKAIDPVPGRLALFECGPNSMHGVRVITHKQAVRLSCAVYYLAKARPSACRMRALFVPNRSKGGVPPEVA